MYRLLSQLRRSLRKDTVVVTSCLAVWLVLCYREGFVSRYHSYVRRSNVNNSQTVHFAVQEMDISDRDDRDILIPTQVSVQRQAGKLTEEKVILLWTRFYANDWEVPEGSGIFQDQASPVNHCLVTRNKSLLLSADAVLIHMRDIKTPRDLPQHREPRQIWIMYLVESPYHSEVNLSEYNGLFNWTSTYSPYSSVPSPYGQYEPYSKPEHGAPTLPSVDSGSPPRAKARLAAWFVTNCRTPNQREDYVTELQKHIPVDVYGPCSRNRCDNISACLDMLRGHYTFYLALENSNCRHYISEKFWHNALEHDVIPVAMGARKEDYLAVAPPGSFLHVEDFSSPAMLARHMRRVRTDSRLYNDHFQWKSQGGVTADIVRHPPRKLYWCSLCKALHDVTSVRKAPVDIGRWWSVPYQCHG